MIKLLRVAEADESTGHPVGEHREVGSDVLTEFELVFDLRVVRIVVVDVDRVLDLDSGVLLEPLEGWVALVVVLVEVERPVRPVEGLVGCRQVFRGLWALFAAGRTRGEGKCRGQSGTSGEHRSTAHLR